MIVYGYLLALVWGVACVVLSALCYKLGMKKSLSRKIVHVLIGFEWAILYIFHGVGPHFLAVCVAFTVMLFIEYRMKLLPMMSSDTDNAPGTVYYGISMTAMAVASLFLDNYIFAFGIAVFVTSFGDGFAGIVGSLVKKCNPRVYKNKTLFGAISNLLFSFLSVLIFSRVFALGIGIGFALLISILAVGLELIGERGLDNIILPIGVSIFTYFIIRSPSVALEYALPIVLTPFIIALVTEKDVLTRFGTIAAVVLDFIVSVAFGNIGFLFLLLFLGLSVVVDKIKRRAKRREDVSEKGDKRDECQVLANGLVAMFSAMFFLVDKSPVFMVAYFASLAEAFSDTCASGLGAFSKKTYDIFRFKTVENGISGGMSVIGTLASLLAPALLTLVPLLFGVITIIEYAIIVACAFLGAVFDSLLGSLIQAKYKCAVCEKITEKRIHCDTETTHSSGIRFITNDTVNLMSTLFSAALAAILFLAVR